ncbi:Bgt-1375 [Blumeria graminis f. sp. tritici]|uniref:Bgt-1375 n=2 Tax=Blumeria graminis f. sp. tritici TaxID=62690 RepID=A0A381LEQ6_BLUGR|nr:hypothetical protein BGT96224_1375 [Blumeria graminis f. sp. tritici 96224]VDB93336.1 Bgt-1375 [Blumeria graminis f. sp. tritici]
MKGMAADTVADDNITPEITSNVSAPFLINDAFEQITSGSLNFLSVASPEAIGGVAVVLAVLTYLVLGRVGLVLLGVLGGIVLHETWERRNASDNVDARNEKSLDIIKRLLDKKSQEHKIENHYAKTRTADDSSASIPPETASAISELVDAIIRDYVEWWYNPINPKDTSFATASRQTLNRALKSIYVHLSNKRAADSFLDFLTNCSSMTIVFLTELSTALSTSSKPAEEAVYSYLSANPDSSLANVLNEQNQSKKLKMITIDLLRNFLEKSTLECEPTKTFLTEIVSGLVLEMALKTCSKPEWINQWIVSLLEDGEPDLSQAIDAGMDPSTDLPSSPFPNLENDIGTCRAQLSSEMKKQIALSAVDDDMSEALEEVKRLSNLIAEEDAKKKTASRVHSEMDEKLHAAPSEYNLKDTQSGPIVSRKRSIRSSVSETIRTPENRYSNIVKLDTSRTPTRTRESSISPTISVNNSFTNFDQIVPSNVLHGLQDNFQSLDKRPIFPTLHNANIVVYDDSPINDRGKLRNKPILEYLIQIEPASSDYPGWMIVRRYADFEILHEVLRRIAQVSGVTAFSEQHQALPSWKDYAKKSLRGELERYLRDSLWYQPLADSEGMKRFLKKDQEPQTSGQPVKNGFPGLGWPTPSAFENMGKGVLEVLTSAPKGVAEGGKAITGVLNNIGNLGHRKSTAGQPSYSETYNTARFSVPSFPRSETTNSLGSFQVNRTSEDSTRSSIPQTQSTKSFPTEQRSGYIPFVEEETRQEARSSSSTRSSISGRRGTIHHDSSRASSRKGTPNSSPVQSSLCLSSLPPLPDEIPDNYVAQREGYLATKPRTGSNHTKRRSSSCTASSHQWSDRQMGRKSSSITLESPIARKVRQESTPLTEAETKVAVELIFAVINEMYTISSAWNIRRTLLAAAKAYFLRPGNPSLAQIRTLLQESVISANTSDASIAAYLRKVRENCLPTEDEMKSWPAAISEEEKERLRVKARKLLVERGVPTALMGVMGQAATSEALGRIFDCLQIEEVSRGLIFGFLLQALRIITH